MYLSSATQYQDVRSCVSLFLGRQFGDERVPIRQPELSRDDFQAIAVREQDVAISQGVSKRSRHYLGVFVCEHDSESSVHGEPEDDQRLHYLSVRRAVKDLDLREWNAFTVPRS